MLPSVTLGQCDFWVLSRALWVWLIWVITAHIPTVTHVIWVITAHIPIVTHVITVLRSLCHVSVANIYFLLPTKGYLIVRLQPREGDREVNGLVYLMHF